MSDGDDQEGESEAIEERLEDAAAALEAAETEGDLDDAEATLEEIESEIEAADLPAPDEEEEDPTAALEGRLEELREELSEARGPYAEEVREAIEGARSTIEGTRWTETGEEALAEAVEAFLETAGDTLGAALGADVGPDTEAQNEALAAADGAIEEADPDPDADAETLATLVEATETLEAAVEDAEEYDDLSVRAKLRVEGFYDVLEGRKHKDFPPEWSALKEWEKRDDVEMVLLCLELMDSEFMERHCLEALERMGNPDCVDAMLERAERRDQDAIEVIGTTGHATGEIVETLEEFLDGDPELQLVVLKTLGQLGATESTGAVADLLAAEEPRVRSRAARALGLLGDPRAVAPLGDVLDGDEPDRVRASAAWALVRIGTREALEAAAEHADDRSYIVQSEAEPAVEALDRDAPTA